MATANVMEFSDLSFDANNRVVPVGDLSLIVASANVTYTTSAQLTLNTKTRFVRIIADADVHVAEGTNPTATATSGRIEANVAEYFGVQPKGVTGRKLAFYDGSS